MPLATVKGFRKGAVPKALVEKQYAAIKVEVALMKRRTKTLSPTTFFNSTVSSNLRNP
jgi:FKBP-type peptidyl-prolyl cis-trans isomerase (trigger factor)